MNQEVQDWLEYINRYLHDSGGFNWSTKPIFTFQKYVDTPQAAYDDTIKARGTHEKGLSMKNYFLEQKRTNSLANSPGVKKCKRSQKLNRKSGRCRKTPCAKGETRDVSSRRCRKKKCSSGKTRDVSSHRCRKKKSPVRKSPSKKRKSQSKKRKSPSKKSRR